MKRKEEYKYFVKLIIEKLSLEEKIEEIETAFDIDWKHENELMQQEMEKKVNELENKIGEEVDLRDISREEVTKFYEIAKSIYNERHDNQKVNGVKTK